MDIPILKVFMYLTYLDDSGTGNKGSGFQVLAAVLMEDRHFYDTELAMAIPLVDLVTDENREKFKEFHACELFGGYGPFDGIEHDKRMHAIEWLLGLVKTFSLPVIYGAVDLSRLHTKPYASASPLDIAFRICTSGAEHWLVRNAPSELALLISDESKKDKKQLRDSFRQMRPKKTPPDYSAGRLGHFHDDMFFGDSRDSIGIQLADLCAYFIGKHLKGDADGEGFYKIIEHDIVFSSVEPAQ